MKIELELPDKPEVHYIAGALNLDPDAVVGKLVRVWSWFDKHTTDGNALGVTYALLDRITSVAGFGEAMAFTGWMDQQDKTLVMPKFDSHTSKSAKERALTAKRVTKKRNADVTLAPLPREEKRRKEKKELKGEVLPDWLPPEKWADFVEHRKSIRKPMTEKARDRMLAHLEAMKAKGHDVLTLIDTAIRSGWQDVYEPKAAGQFNSPSVPRPGGGRREL